VIRAKTFRNFNVMFKQFLKDETGLELSEYAVAAALIAVAAAGVFTALGDAISLKINDLGGHISTGK
jgi:pilus assembly protein Flp/PilA